MKLPVFDNYQIGSLVNEDHFGWTFTADGTAADGGNRMIRVLKAQSVVSEFAGAQAQQLVELQESLPGIRPVYAVSPESDNSPLAFLSEADTAADAQSMPALLSKLQKAGSLRGILRVLREMAAVVQVGHDHNLYHGGLRPEVFSWKNNPSRGLRARLGGYGEVAMGGLQYLAVDDFVFYLAPEQLESGDPSGNRMQGWDLYTFGVIAYYGITQQFPRLEKLHQLHAQRPNVFDGSALVSFGEITEASRGFAEQLKAEAVSWPPLPGGGKISSSLMKEIDALLSVAPEGRPASLRYFIEAVQAELAETPMPERSNTDRFVPTGGPAKVVEKPASRPIPTTGPVGQKSAAQAAAPATAEKQEVASQQPSADPQVKAASENSTQSVNAGKGKTRKQEVSAKSDAKPAKAKKQKAAKPAKVKEKPDRAASTGDEGLALRTQQYFADRPALKWKLCAGAFGAAAICMGCLLAFALYEKHSTTASLTDVTLTAQQKAQDLVRQKNTEVAEMQQNVEQLQELAEKSEDQTTQFRAQARLAQQVLREAQGKGDEFFRLILENRDTDVPEFRARRAEVLQGAESYYKGLISVYGSNPSFIISSADAYFYLGRIYREGGQFEQALTSFVEAERRYLELMKNEDLRDPAFLERLALANHELGKLAFRDSKHSRSRHYFTESARYWSEFRSELPAEESRATLNIHENSLAIVEAEHAMGHLGAALDGAKSVALRLVDLDQQLSGTALQHRVTGAQGKAFELSGMIFESQGQITKAKEAYKQASNCFALAVEQNAASDSHQLGLGNTMARLGLLTQDRKKLEAAVQTLAGVVGRNPYEVSYQTSLAEVYGVMSQAQRDGGQLKQAVALEREAIEILRPLVEMNTELSPQLLFSYSTRLAHLAEMLGDMNEYEASREPLQEAADILTIVNQEEGASREHRRSLAKVRGLAGFAQEESGDKTSAKEHYLLAKADWEELLKSDPNDQNARQALRWTKERLSDMP